MDCPKCSGNLSSIDYNGIEIDRCDKCHGLWFDQLEKEDLKKLRGAESIDIGDEFMGAKYNQAENVPCPRCQQTMQHIGHSDPFDIKFETCTSCHGSFFDAGEFRDYLEDEIIEQFQSVLAQLDK